MESRADFNNNPGNLRPPKDVTYEGQIGVDDKGFAIFETPAFGERALKNDIKIKIEKGINTPEKFIDMYAPKGKDAYGDENSEEGRENYKIWLAHKLGLKSTTDPFPDDALDKLPGAIKAFEGGTWNKPDEKKDEVKSDSTEVAAADSGDRVESAGGSEVPGYMDEVKPFAGIVGGGIGTGIATSVETGKKLAPLVPNIINAINPKAQVNPMQPQSRWSLQRYLNSQIPGNLQMSLTDLEKVSGGNKIRTMSEVQNALKAIQKVDAERIAKTASIDPKTGMPRKIYTTVPGRAPVDLTQFEVKPTGPVRQALSRELSSAGELTRAVAPSVGRIAMGGLGGAGAVMSGLDAYELSKKIEEDKKKGIKHETIMGMTPDEWRLRTKQAATVGGAMSMWPAGITQLGGLALSSPELAWSIYDWYKNRGNTGSPAAGAPTGGGLPAAGDPERLSPQ
jgi:hypothetical protein